MRYLLRSDRTSNRSALRILSYVHFKVQMLRLPAFQAKSVQQVSLCGADPLVCARPPGPALRPAYKFFITEQADGGVGRGPGGPPHPTQAAANFRRLSVASPTYRLEPVVV